MASAFALMSPSKVAMNPESACSAKSALNLARYVSARSGWSKATRLCTSRRWAFT